MANTDFRCTGIGRNSLPLLKLVKIQFGWTIDSTYKYYIFFWLIAYVNHIDSHNYFCSLKYYTGSPASITPSACNRGIPGQHSVLCSVALHPQFSSKCVFPTVWNNFILLMPQNYCCCAHCGPHQLYSLACSPQTHSSSACQSPSTVCSTAYLHYLLSLSRLCAPLPASPPASSIHLKMCQVWAAVSVSAVWMPALKFGTEQCELWKFVTIKCTSN